MASKAPPRCDSKNCLNGWIWHMGTDYPCSACQSYGAYQLALRKARQQVVGTKEYIALARGRAGSLSWRRGKEPNQLDIC